jgi:hypothetical protein
LSALKAEQNSLASLRRTSKCQPASRNELAEDAGPLRVLRSWAGASRPSGWRPQMQHANGSSETVRPIAVLRRDWQLLFGAPPPPDLGRTLLSLALSWKKQERLHGGYPPAITRELKRLALQLDRSGELEMERQTVLKPGTRLARDWNGRTIHVEVLTDGFLHDGRTYPSLSHIARAITGTRWSGPRFFGLAQRKKNAASHA